MSEDALAVALGVLALVGYAVLAALQPPAAVLGLGW